MANVIWEKKYSQQNDAKWLSDSRDHILVYAKNKESWRPYTPMVLRYAKIEPWLRPAPSQFKIYWDENKRLYQPDFIVETDDTIYMAETKMQKDMDSVEVEKKAKAALEYCRNASEHNLQNGGKEWKYLLIPHDGLAQNSSFDRLLISYGRL